MACIGKLFGFSGKNKQRIQKRQEAIKKFRVTEETLTKIQRYLEKMINEETENVQRYGTTSTQHAQDAMKIKKQYERELEQVVGTLYNIEFQRETVQMASKNVKLLSLMETSVRLLNPDVTPRKFNQFLATVDEMLKVQQLADEIAEGVSYLINFDEDMDEDELLAELADLERQDLEEKMLDVSLMTAAKSPGVPADNLSSDEDGL